MKVVVDIPSWLYNAIMKHKEPVYSQSLGEAVRDGTPLPKGHGRLIDADDIDNHIIGHVDTRSCPTIIEADKGETE